MQSKMKLSVTKDRKSTSVWFNNNNNNKKPQKTKKKEKCPEIRWAVTCFGPQVQGVIQTLTSFLYIIFSDLPSSMSLCSGRLALLQQSKVPQISYPQTTNPEEGIVFPPTFQGNVLRFTPIGQLDHLGSHINPGINL